MTDYAAVLKEADALLIEASPTILPLFQEFLEGRDLRDPKLWEASDDEITNLVEENDFDVSSFYKEVGALTAWEQARYDFLKKLIPPYAVAFHEAGHAIISRAVETDVEPHYVTIVTVRTPDSHTRGCYSRSGGVNYNLTDAAHREMIVTLAGPMAESLYKKEPFELGESSGDEQSIREKLERRCKTDKEKEALLAKLTKITRRLVKANWKSITALAEALVIEKTIIGPILESEPSYQPVLCVSDDDAIIELAVGKTKRTSVEKPSALATA
jgi:hypothetical protein